MMRQDQLVVMSAYCNLYPRLTSLTLCNIYIVPLTVFDIMDLIFPVFMIIIMSDTKTMIEQFDEQTMMAYLENFLEVTTFKNIQNGRLLLEYIRHSSDHQRVRTFVRKVLGLFHTDSAGARVCALQFLKQAMECNNWVVVQSVQKSLLPKVIEIIQYRPHIRSLQRGSSFFIKEIDKNISDDQMTNLIKLSTTFFRMIHQCLYVWGAVYFPGSVFDRMRIKLQKRFDFPPFPSDFKFFNDKKIENFKKNCSEVIRRMKQYNEEVSSRSSIEKKRETSVKSSKMNSTMIKKNNQSQSIDNFKEKKQEKSTKQREKQQNNMRDHNKEKGNIQKSKEKRTQDSNKRRKQKDNIIKQQQIDRKDSKLMKADFDLPLGQIVEGKSLESAIKINSARSSSKESKPEPQKSRQSQKFQRFKTISEREQSDGGRYSIDESKSGTQQLSQIEIIHQGIQQSPRSQPSLTLKNKNLALKKFGSEQLIEPFAKKESTSLHEEKRGKQKKYVQMGKQSIKQKDKKEKQKNNVERKEEKIIQKKKQQINKSIQLASQKQNNNALKKDKSEGKNVTLNQKNVKCLNQQQQKKKEQAAKYKKRCQGVKQDINVKQKKGEQNAIKKFVSSSSQNSLEEEQDQNKLIDPSHQQIKYNKETSNRLNQIDVPLESNRGASSVEEIKLTKGNVQSSNHLQIQHLVKMSKPQKIKGNKSSKTIFENFDVKSTQKIKANAIQQVEMIDISKKKENSLEKKADRFFSESSNPIKPNYSYNNIEQIKIQTLEVVELKPISKEQKQKQKDVVILQTKRKDKVFEKSSETKKEPIQNKANTIQFNGKIQYKGQRQFPNKAISIKDQNKQKIQTESIKQQYDQAQTNSPIKDIVSSYRKKTLPISSIQKPKLQSPRTDNYDSLIYSGREEIRQSSISARPEERQSMSKSRLRKFQQINLSIHPHDQRSSEMKSPGRAVVDADEVRSILRKQLAEEFDLLRSSLLSHQQENIENGLSQIVSKMHSEKLPKEHISVECGIQTLKKSKPRLRVGHKKKNKFFDQPNEGIESSVQNKNLVNFSQELVVHTAVQRAVDIPKDRSESEGMKLQNISNREDRQSSLNKKKKDVLRGQFQPNTLLYALYRKKSMNI